MNVSRLGLVRLPPVSFRLGSSSYVWPLSILENTRRLAGQVGNVELLVGESHPEAPLFTTAEADELQALAAARGLTYTVHLPLDLRLGVPGRAGEESLEKVRWAIEGVRPLRPLAQVVHLENERLCGAEGGPAARAEWLEQSLRALERMADWAGGLDGLAVENIEAYPAELFEEVAERSGAGRCVDIGHLWLAGQDPLPHLERAWGRIKIIHLHGVAGRDHRSLALHPPEQLAAVASWLCRKRYTGVVTLEVFTEDELRSSWNALAGCLGGAWGGV